jgi:hypothetical protein
MYTSSPRPSSGTFTVGVVGMEISLDRSLRGLKKAIPKSFSVGFVTEAASLSVILLSFSNLVNLIELERKLMICRTESVGVVIMDISSARCTDHLKKTTGVYQHVIQSKIHIALVNFHIGHNLGVLNLLFEHLQSSLHYRGDSGSFQTEDQKIRVQL